MKLTFEYINPVNETSYWEITVNGAKYKTVDELLACIDRDYRFDLQFFIDKYEAIPEENWCESKMYIPGTHKKCALGHTGHSDNGSKYVTLTDEGAQLLKIARSVSRINDVKGYGYDQDTPKQRVLAYLRDLKDK